MATTTKQWSKMTVEELKAEATATKERRDALLARMKAFSARVREQPLSAADACEFQVLMTENGEVEGKLLALYEVIEHLKGSHPVERRSRQDRRSGIDRRSEQQIRAQGERRSGVSNRRSGKDRRSKSNR